MINIGDKVALKDGGNVVTGVINDPMGRMLNLKNGYTLSERAVELIPAEFDWDAFKAGKIAIHCDTEDKAKAFLKECDTQGIVWASVKCKASADWTIGRNKYSCYACWPVNDEDAGRLYHGEISYQTAKGLSIIDYPFNAQPKYWTGKVFCAEAIDANLTSNKIYFIENGVFTWDDGAPLDWVDFTSFEHFSKWASSFGNKFYEVKE